MRKLLEKLKNYETICKNADRAWKSLDEENQAKVVKTLKEQNRPLNLSTFKQTYEKLKSQNAYIRFHKENAISIRPRATHNFRGIYGWNISKLSFDDFIKYVPTTWKKMELLTFFKSNDPSKILREKYYTHEDLIKDLDRITKEVSQEHKNIITEIYKRLPNVSAFEKLILILEDFENTGNSILDKNSNTMVPVEGLNFATKYLIKLGYQGVIIYDVEICIFKLQFLDIISTIPNPIKS